MPAPKVFFEKIGDTEYEIEDAKLDVFNDIVLWDQNPRLIPYISKIGRASCRERVQITVVGGSSRRRHTRSLRDWSSDVCSSDLSTPDINHRHNYQFNNTTTHASTQSVLRKDRRH